MVPQWVRRKTMNFRQLTTKVDRVYRNNGTRKLVIKYSFKKVKRRATYQDGNGQARWPGEVTTSWIKLCKILMKILEIKLLRTANWN